jgi:hypothetical protein
VNKNINIFNTQMKKKLFLLYAFVIVFFSSYFSQTYPFTINTILQPPSSPYLSDYFAIGSDKLTANVTFNDFNEPSWNFKLRLTIESNNIKIQTSPTFIPAQPITIYPGTPLLLPVTIDAPFLNDVFAVVKGSITVKTSTVELDHGGAN